MNAMISVGQPSRASHCFGADFKACFWACFRTGVRALVITSVLVLTAHASWADNAALVGQCGEAHADLRLISQVQGDLSQMDGDSSPLLSQQVVLEALVTLDGQPGVLANGASSERYNGFWIQEETADDDGLDTTSEGLFVSSTLVDVSAGDRVRVRGTVSELDDVTQLVEVDALTVCDSGHSLPTAIKLHLPVASQQAFESLEGMRVQNQQLLLVADLYGAGYGLGNYGQVVVSSQLHFQPTDVARPGSAVALQTADDYALDRLLVDDGVTAAYPSFIPFPDSNGYGADNPVRIGDTFQTLSGVLHHYADDYLVVPGKYVITPTAARTSAPVVADDANLVIASMNVLNYFNGDGQGGGFPTTRGARTAAAFEMQSDKVVAAISAMDADILGLMELENDGFGTDSAIQHLLEAVNAGQVAGDEYRFIAPSVSQMGTDAIQVGLFYRPDVVTLAGITQVLNSSTSPSDDEGVLFDDQRHRPAIVQSFGFNNQVLTVAVNHLKSKGSSCGEPNEGDDGQGNCNLQRQRAARGLIEYLDSDPTEASSDAVLVIGDLNAYSQEDPIVEFEQAGYVDLKQSAIATEEQPFSYSYSGRLGSLDHALASPDLSGWAVSADAWHINSVEDSLMDYQTESNGQVYRSVDHYAAADAYRSSDHDPIVIGLNVPLATASNRAPVRETPLETITISSLDQTIRVDFSTYFSDPDGDSLSFSATNLPTGWSLGASGDLEGSAAQTVIDRLPLSITLTVSDGALVVTDTVLVQSQIAADPSETDPSETDPSETDPSETDPSETDPSETDPSETDPDSSESDSGVDGSSGSGGGSSGSSGGAFDFGWLVALLAALGWSTRRRS